MMNVGIIGSGFIVPVFLSASKMFKEYHVVGIWGRHTDKLINFKNDVEYYTTDLNKLLNDKRIDVIYVALPNSLHYEYAMKALEHGKHVILEKPFTVNYRDSKKLIDYAKKKKLIIFEAIVTKHNPMYKKMIKLINKLGDIKVVTANFSQYSRRYDKFKNGEKIPVFDAKMGGGALLDLNVYNIHFVIGMFNKPKKVIYYPNIEKNVDTSGILILDYGKFKCSLVAAKDCKTESYALIQGEKGYLRCNTTTSRCGSYTLAMNNGKVKNEYIEDTEFGAWKYELEEFLRLYKKKDLHTAYEYNKTTLLVMDVLDKAIKSANLYY